jgi:hypothetical protein
MKSDRTLTWSAVLSRDELVGGDAQVFEDGFTFRGPLRSIDLAGPKVTLTLAWCAKEAGGHWVSDKRTTFEIDSALVPHRRGSGIITATVPSSFWVSLHPRILRGLDPDTVEGLLPSWRRLLNMFPQIGFDEVKLANAFSIEGVVHKAEGVCRSVENPTIEDYFNSIPEQTAERVACSYIEEMLELQDAHKLVY